MNYMKIELNKALYNDDQRRVTNITVARLLHFNKRRSAEVPSLTKGQWDLKEKWKEGAADSRLSEFEMKLVNELQITYVKGKGNRFVPIIFLPDWSQGSRLAHQKGN